MTVDNPKEKERETGRADFCASCRVSCAHVSAHTSPPSTPVTHPSDFNGLSWETLISILRAAWPGALRWPQKGCVAPEELKDSYLSHTGNPGGPGGPMGPEGPVIP